MTTTCNGSTPGPTSVINDDSLFSLIEPRQELEPPARLEGLDETPGASNKEAHEPDALERGDSAISSNDEITYPEGGREAYLVTFGCFCALFACFGILNTIGTLDAYLSDNQLKHYNKATVSWIFSVFVFVCFFCGLQIGPIFDAHGPRALIFVGSICLVTSLMLLGVCTEYWHFILDFSLLCGLGCSLLFTPAISAIAHYFMRGRGAMTGLAAAGGSCGGVVFPLAFQSLIPQVGWGWTTRIIGFIVLILCGIANILIRSRSALRTNHVGLKSMLPDFTIFWDGTGAFALATAGIFLYEWGLFIPITYLTSNALQLGVSSTFSYQLMAIFNAASCFGRIAPGYAADAIGRFNAMIITLTLCAISTFALWLPAQGTGSVSLLIAYAIVFGFASGGNISLAPPCIGQLCHTQHYARYYATAYTIVSLSTLTGLPLAGALVSLQGGSYRGCVLFTGLCYIVSIVAFAAVKIGKHGWNLKVIW